MNCVCGHPLKDHVLGGRCRVPDCSCEVFQPGDTLGRGLDQVAHAVRALVVLIGLLAALAGPVAAAERREPPNSFAPIADAARAASIVIRAPGAGDSVVSALASPKPDRAAPLADLLSVIDKRQRLAPTPGVIVSPQGFALTSARAMLRLSDFEVFRLDGTPLPATLVGMDLRSDVAVLKLEGGVAPLPHLPLGGSGRIGVGEWVVAVGAPPPGAGRHGDRGHRHRDARA